MENNNRQGCRWVKASEFEYNPRKRYFAKWEEGYPPDMAIKSSGWFQESDGTFFWHEQGFVPVGADEHDKLYILDESIEPCATSSEIGFAEWLGNGFKMLALNNIWECFNDDYCDGKNIQLDYHYTTEQLYTIYQNQKQKVND